MLKRVGFANLPLSFHSCSDPWAFCPSTFMFIVIDFNSLFCPRWFIFDISDRLVHILPLKKKRTKIPLENHFQLLSKMPSTLLPRFIGQIVLDNFGLLTYRLTHSSFNRPQK